MSIVLGRRADLLKEADDGFLGRGSYRFFPVLDWDACMCLAQRSTVGCCNTIGKPCLMFPAVQIAAGAVARIFLCIESIFLIRRLEGTFLLRVWVCASADYCTPIYLSLTQGMQ